MTTQNKANKTAQAKSKEMLHAAIAQAVKSTKAVQVDTQKALVLLLNHAANHGDWTEANTLAHEMNLKSGKTGVNNQAVVAWIVAHLGLEVDEKEGVFTKGNFSKAACQKLVERVKDKSDEYNLPQWHTFKPNNGGFKGLEAEATLAKALDKIEKAYDKVQENPENASKVDMHVSADTVKRLQMMVDAGMITLQ